MREFAESLEGAAVHTFDQAVLAPVRQLNAHALETVMGCARHPDWAGSSWDAVLGPRFPHLSAAFRGELARSPVLLLEFAGSLSDSDAALTCEAHPPPFLPLSKALELSQITLTLAWTFSRQDLAAGRIIFGLTAVEAQRIRNLDVRNIPRLAERRSGALRPRWFDRPNIWQELLRHPDAKWGSRAGPPYIRILQRELARYRLATSATRPTRRGDP